MEFTPHDLEDLKRARQLLENPSLAARMTGKIGLPIEKAFETLPKSWSQTVSTAVRVAMGRALDVAVMTLERQPNRPSLDLLHTVAVAATGAVGGAFGLASLPVELPISTTIMLRSIADIARSEGESLEDVKTRLACLEVFALGGRNPGDNASETGYFAVRSLLARTISEAAQFITERGLAEKGAPVLVRMIGLIANRFGLVVSQKIAAQAVPVIGAVGGGLINTVFIDHFQDIARGHFIIRRLEKVCGPEEVRRQYDLLGPAPQPGPGNGKTRGNGRH